MGNLSYLQGLSASKAGEKSVKYLLHKHLARGQPGRSHKRVHASDMMERFCPRQFALLDLTNKKPKSEYLSTSMATTFKFGYLIQDWVTDVLADIGVAVGDWKCLQCGTVYEMTKRPQACGACQNQRFRYQERVFVSKVSGISGAIDIFAHFPGSPGYVPIEIKTIDKEAFKELVAPLAEHKYRTNLYLRLIAESDDPFLPLISQKQGIVLYVSKGGYGCKDLKIKEWGLNDSPFSPYKEYVVNRSDAVTDKADMMASRLKAFRTGVKGVPLGVCETSTCPRATQCPVHYECFGDKYPGVE